MRVRTEVRRKALVDAAGDLFLEQGYAAVSMAAVADRAECSRVTLYGYFRTKEELFGAFVVEAGRERAEVLAELASGAHAASDPCVQLFELGISYLKLILDPKVVALTRVIIGESARFPELSRVFYERGPRSTSLRITEVLGLLVEQGCLRRVDLTLLGAHFEALCSTDLFDRRLWGLESQSTDPRGTESQSTEQQIEQAVERAVTVFARCYGCWSDAPSDSETRSAWEPNDA